MKRVKLRTADPQAFAKALMREAEVLFPTYVKATVFAIFESMYTGIVMNTPVLTGRARVNWNVTVSGPGKKVIDGDQLITAPGTWFSSTGQPLSSEERANLQRIHDIVMKGGISRKLYATNNLQYIQVLEDGYSGKAPAGMTEISVDGASSSGAKARIHTQALKETP